MHVIGLKRVQQKVGNKSDERPVNRKGVNTDKLIPLTWKYELFEQRATPRGVEDKQASILRCLYAHCFREVWVSHQNACFTWLELVVCLVVAPTATRMSTLPTYSWSVGCFFFVPFKGRSLSHLTCFSFFVLSIYLSISVCPLSIYLCVYLDKEIDLPKCMLSVYIVMHIYSFTLTRINILTHTSIFIDHSSTRVRIYI